MSSRACGVVLVGALAAEGLFGCASNPGSGETPGRAALAAPDGSHKGAVPAPSTAARPVERAYVALVRTSIVPADPRAVGTAALAAGASQMQAPAPSLPEGWGRDPERDGAWLDAAVTGAPSPWRIITAMTRVARTAHVGLVTPEIRAGIGRLMTGDQPAPGFNVYRAPDHRFVVFDVVPGASAATSGVLAGDVLERLADEPVEGLLSPLFPALTRLGPGERVPLGVVRKGHRETIQLELRHAVVSPVESRLLRGGNGYLRIRWFARSDDRARDTAALVRAALASFVGRGARGLVIDLRSALGGIGEADIASALCDGDIVYFVQQPGAATPSPVARQGPRIWSGRRIVFLVNEQTVSAGEDLVLAVRELAPSTVVVGRTTAGGLTEFEPIPLGAGHALIVPTSAVLGPVTRQAPPGHAIVPDIPLDGATVAELLSGRDPELAAAEAALARVNVD